MTVTKRINRSIQRCGRSESRSLGAVGWVVFPGNSCPPPEHQNVTVFGNKVFADVMNMRSYWVRVSAEAND